MIEITTNYDLDCLRLTPFLDKKGTECPDYHIRPVPPFGAKNPKLLHVSLAPSMHAQMPQDIPLLEIVPALFSMKCGINLSTVITTHQQRG